MNDFFVTVSVAVGLALLGWLIKYKGWSFLIAGYNTSSKKEKEKYDEAALCNDVGRFLFAVAGLTFVGSLGILFEINWISKFRLLLTLIITVGFLIYANTGDRYKKK